ncbi:uncharacterized protein [Procambarus clarkii]|uniref:uncharacterized protein n=1 Tax=Procambarus clarkii TaxID=6728 RepID=UPI003741EE42
MDSLREEARQLKLREETKEININKTSPWKVAKDRSPKKTLTRPPTDAPRTANSFAVLEDERCGEPAAHSERKSVRSGGAQAPQAAQKVKEAPKRTLVVGDSQVRHLDRTPCARDRGNRSRARHPGAGIGDIVGNMNDTMMGNRNKPTICISAGGNDVGRVRSEELTQKFRTATELVRSKGGIPTTCGTPPRKGVGNERTSRAPGANRRPERYCKSNATSPTDNWEHPHGGNEMHARDGAHPSRAGAAAAANSPEPVVRGARLGPNCQQTVAWELIWRKEATKVCVRGRKELAK